jgi:hypothetical protein
MEMNVESANTVQFLADIIFKVVGICFASVAIFQLREARKKRMVEMYWKVADEYTSDECHKGRVAIDEINKWIDQRKNELNISKEASSLDSRIIHEYKSKYHDASHGSDKKLQDVQARHQLRFLNQIGILVRKRLIDRDMLFGLIGSGLKIDYGCLAVVLQGHIEAHNEKMYGNVEYLWNNYKGWARYQ